MRNPEEAAAASGRHRSSALYDAEPDEEGVVANVPRRIASRKPTKQKTQSEINSEFRGDDILAGYSKCYSGLGEVAIPRLQECGMQKQEQEQNLQNTETAI